ncbi:MAG: AbrB/MazE/SpoVT family DNA-binding domain-containing protein [Phycisphaeraceae bacterium JB051]
MSQKLIKHGDDWALVIDKQIIEALDISSETEFELSTDEKNLVLKPIREQDVDAKLDQAIDRIHNRFGNAMKKLAE